MAKNKKPQIINQIENVNLEIDYDKLAQAIVKADQNQDDENRFVSGTFAVLASVLFSVLSFIAFLISIIGVVGSIVFFIQNYTPGLISISQNLLITLLLIVSSILIGLFAFVFLKAGKEISKEKDKNYIISAFSGIVSFVALIVALIALAKGIQ